MRKNAKALSLAMAAALTLSGLAGCSKADSPAPATTSETTAQSTAQQTETTTAAAKQEAAPKGASETEAKGAVFSGWRKEVLPACSQESVGALQ